MVVDPLLDDQAGALPRGEDDPGRVDALTTEGGEHERPERVVGAAREPPHLDPLARQTDGGVELGDRHVHGGHAGIGVVDREGGERLAEREHGRHARYTRSHM